MSDSTAVVNPGVQSEYIEIPGSATYSIGYGALGIWVSGVCGWYEISPSPQFQDTYDQMCEAVVLYYEIMEAFEAHYAELSEYKATPKSTRKRMREPSIDLDQVLLKV